MSHLTIAIPTYNRNEKLVFNLRKLLPLVLEEKIIIVDNHSDILVEKTIQGLLHEYPEVDIKIYRNRTNVGIAANFLRCFEYCETDWMWLLSDDDPPYEDAINIIRKDVEQFPDYVFMNYASSMVEKGVSFAMVERTETFYTSGVDDFINRMDAFVNVIFVSSGVYNMQKVLPNLRIGYIYSFSLAPHIAVVMYSLGDTGKALFSTQKLVAFDPPAAKDTWSRLTFVQGINLLMELPIALEDSTYRTLFKKINQWTLTDNEVFEEVAKTYKNSFLKRRYVFAQIVSRGLFKKRRFKDKMRLSRYFLKLYFPEWFLSKKILFTESTKAPLDRL